MPDYKERYKQIAESDWFKKHYEGKSLGNVIEGEMEVVKRTSKGVLANMVKNMDEESLDKTRRSMLTKDEYTDYLMEQFDTGKMTMQQMIWRSMLYGAENVGMI